MRNIDLKKILMKDKHSKVMGTAVILAVLMAFVLSVQYIIPEKVTVVYAGLDGTEKEVIDTRAATVEDMIEAGDLEVSDIDRVSPCEEHDVESGMTINVTKCIETKASIAGKETEILLMPGTVKDNLELNEIKYDKDDEVTPALDTKVDSKTRIVFNEIHTDVEEKTEKVEPEEEVVYDESLEAGSEERTEGTAGEAVYEYTTKYVNGKKADEKKVLKKWNKKPVNTIVKKGPEVRAGVAFGPAGSLDGMEYSSSFTAEATAYYFGENARGATGQLCHYGTCAVDPTVIPYGTRLYVEGYGIAVANDCGGAVKGNIIDLYMHSTDECYQWGRRNVKVYILK